MSKAQVAVLAIFSILLISFSLLFLAATQMSLQQFLGNNPTAAQQIGVSIVEYSLPSGYQEQRGRDLGFLKMVLVTPEESITPLLEDNMILLSTTPTIFGLSEEQFQQELRLALLRSNESVTTLELVTEKSTLIQNHEITFNVYESFGEYDLPTRMMISSAFPGKNGDVIVIFAGPQASWDQTAFDKFIASIQ